MLDLDVVAGGLLVADLAAIVLLADTLEGGEASGFARGARLGVDVARDKLRLGVFDAPLAAVRLDEADDEEVVVGGGEDVEVEAGAAVPPVEQGGLHEVGHDVQT